MAVAALGRATSPGLAAGATTTRLRARPWLTAGVGGVLVAAAMPPVYLLPGLLGFAALVHLLHGEARPGRAFALGWVFGTAFFVTGLHWIAIAFLADAERYGLAAAIPAVLGLCAFLGLTVGLAAWVVALPRWRSLEARALAFAPAWTFAELVRAGTIVDFPWNPAALAWTAGDATMQGVAWLGTYGLSCATVAAAGLAARCLEPGGPARARLAGAVVPASLGLALLVGGSLRLPVAEGVGLTPVTLRLVQGNVPQAMKWDRERRREWFFRHLELTAGAAAGPAPVAVVWPESAVPYQLETDADARDYIAQALPPGAYGLLGGDRFVVEGDSLVGASNSLFVLDAEARLRDRYDKVDLVPFGEFTPFRAVLGRLGLGKLVAGSVDFEPGPSRRTIALPGLPPFSPLICYEAVFPGRAAPDDGPRPAWLLNVTNDAWFGTSAGPYQHLAQARLRAVEEGLPLARAANTGISVVTDPYGRVQARLGLNQTGVIDAPLPEALPAASFARRNGAWLLPALLAGTALLAFLVEILRRRLA